MKKTMMKLLSVVMALMMLFGCFSTLTFAAAPHEHDKTTKGETIAPRCNAYGYTLYTCSCGETWATDIEPKTEGKHSFTEGKSEEGEFDLIPAVDPTCEKDGKAEAKACVWCGKELEGGEKAGDKTGHNEQWVLEAADCNYPERIVFKCTNANCDDKDEPIPADKIIYLDEHSADGHNFKYNITKDPKCVLTASLYGTLDRVADGRLVGGYTLSTTNGEAEYECVDCGVKYTGIVVEWHSHSFVKRDNGKIDDCYNFRATWDECLECGLAKNYTSVDAIKHILTGEGNVPATCYKEGYEKCSREGCGYEGVVPMTDHYTMIVTPETCVSKGLKKCFNPGCTYQEAIEPTGHNMTDADLSGKDIAADCTTEGKNFCANGTCDYFLPIPALGHVIGTANASDIASTCCVAGKDYCSRTGCTFYVDLPLDETKHVFEYECPIDAKCEDCTHAGRIYKCQNAGCAKYTDAKHDEHVWGTQKYYTYMRNGLEVTAPYTGAEKFCDDVALYLLCTNPGCTCRKDDGFIAGNPTSGTHLNLVFVSDTDYVAPTCTSDGYVMVNCTECAQGHQKLVGQAAYNFFAGEIARLEALENTTEVTTLYNRYNKYVDTTATDYRPLLTLGHQTLSDAGIKIIPDAYNGEKLDRDATCWLEGYVCEAICNRNNNGTVCEHVVREAQVLPKDPNNHTIPVVKVGDNPATTTTVETDYRYYDYEDAYALIVSYEATCTSYAVSYYKCTKCNDKDYRHDEEAGYNEFNHVTFVRDDDFLELDRIDDPFTKHVANPAVCGGADGNKEYYTCDECHEVVILEGVREADDLSSTALAKNKTKRDPADRIYTLADTVIHLDHYFAPVSKQVETCTLNGWEAYNLDCACGATSPTSMKLIPAHGDDYAFVIDSSMAYEPTCTIPGVKEGRYCGKCKTRNDVAVSGTWDYKSGKTPDLSAPKSSEPWYLPGTGHDKSMPYMKTLGAIELAKVMNVQGDCVKTSYNVRYCTYCLDSTYDVLSEILLGDSEEKTGKNVASGAWVIYNYVEPVYHVYPEAIYETDAPNGIYKNVTDNFTGVAGFDECETDKIYTVACKNGCAEDKVVKTEAAPGHYYMKDGKKVVIDNSCKEYDKHAGNTCEVCDKLVGVDILKKHDIVEVINYRGCLVGQNGERFWACQDCEARYFLDDSDPYAIPYDPKTSDDDYGTYVEIIPALTEDHDFYKFSTDAEGKLIFKAPTLEADGYVSRECTKCGTVREVLPKLVPTLDVAVESEKTTVSAGDTFYVELTYAGDCTKFNALQVKLGYDADKLKFLAEGFDHELPAGVAVKEENSGVVTISVYSLDGIEPGAEGGSVKIYFRAKYSFAESDIVAINSATAFATAGGTPISASVLKIVTSDPAKLTSVITGELNGFAGIDAGDAIVMMDLIYSKQYNPAADMDKDGNVTVADFAILNKIIATDGSNDAYKTVISSQVTAKSGVYYSING